MDQTAQYLHAIYHDLANVLRQSAARHLTAGLQCRQLPRVA
jgi:hypothetical protein